MQFGVARRNLAGLLTVFCLACTAALSLGQSANPLAEQLTRAGQAIKKGDLAAAEILLNEVFKANPEQAGALNLLGLVRVQQQRLDEAQTLFERSIKANPKYAGPVSNLGILCKQRNERDRALKLFQTAARLAPRDPSVLYNLAAFQAELGDFGAAIARMKTIPAKDRPADCWTNLARLSLASGDYAHAQEALLQELARNPESIATLRELAGTALKLNDTEDAWKYMVQARRLAPNSPELLYEYAQVSLKNRLATEAAVAMRKAVLLDPDRPEYQLALGNALMESPMESGDALPFFERYVKMKPEDPQGHGALGWAYYSQKDYPNARREIEESLRLQPDQVIGYYQLGAIAFDSGDNARALELLTKAVALEPGYADAHLTLGMAYSRDGQYDRARESFETVVRLKPEEPRAHYQLSQIYRRLGDTDRAAREAQLYQEAMKTFRANNERNLSSPSSAVPARKPDKKQ